MGPPPHPAATLRLFFFNEAIVSGVYLLVKCGHARRHIHLLCVRVYIYISQNEPPCIEIMEIRSDRDQDHTMDH